MENIKKAIKHFECMKSDAVAVLDSGFGTKPNESNTVYKNRKLYAELAINALEKQMPYRCGSIVGKCKCGKAVYPHMKYCSCCGQDLDWSDTK